VVSPFFIAGSRPGGFGHPRGYTAFSLFPHFLVIPLENPRHRKTLKRGRKRFFNEAIHALRMHVERTFAWEDQFKRLLLRFERIQQRHYGMKLMAYTLINLREFCGV
jgi:transposase